jgi:hypothetical protein
VCIVGLGSSWTFLVIFFNDSWGSTLFISLSPFFHSAANKQTKLLQTRCRCTLLKKNSRFLDTQDQTPDETCHVHDSQCDPCDLFSTLSPFRQVLPRFPIRFSTEPRQMPFEFLFSTHQNPVHIPPSSLQVYSRKEFDDQLWEVFWTHEMVNWIPTQVPFQGYPRSVTVIHHLLFQFVSQGNVLVLPTRNRKSPNQGFLTLRGSRSSSTD